MKLNVNIEVTEEQLKDLLCTAFEGGSNYWIDSVECFELSEEKAEYMYEVPFTEDNFVEIETIDNEKLRLDKDSILKGIKILNKEYPHHIRNIINDNIDACTGDAYLQCCLFGEVIYG